MCVTCCYGNTCKTVYVLRVAMGTKVKPVAFVRIVMETNVQHLLFLRIAIANVVTPLFLFAYFYGQLCKIIALCHLYGQHCKPICVDWFRLPTLYNQCFVFLSIPIADVIKLFVFTYSYGQRCKTNISFSHILKPTL